MSKHKDPTVCKGTSLNKTQEEIEREADERAELGISIEPMTDKEIEEAFGIQ
jgi:hypothetical protein